MHVSNAKRRRWKLWRGNKKFKKIIWNHRLQYLQMQILYEKVLRRILVLKYVTLISIFFFDVISILVCLHAPTCGSKCEKVERILLQWPLSYRKRTIQYCLKDGCNLVRRHVYVPAKMSNRINPTILPCSEIFKST